MSRLIERVSFIILPIFTLAACGAGPNQRLDAEDYSAPLDAPAVDTAAQPSAASEGGAAALETDVEATSVAQAYEVELAQLFANGEDETPIEIGQYQGWTFQYDRASRLTIASNGEQSLGFDMETLDEATLNALADAGVPEEILFSVRGTICRAACVGAATALGVAGIAAVCSVAGAITLGTATIPCAVWAGVIVGGSLAAAGSICRDFCPK